MNEKLNERLEELRETWCGELEVSFQVLDSDTVSSSIDTSSTYSLTTSTSTQTLTGSRDHDCTSKSECLSKIRHYCTETENGGNATANQAIIEMVRADPVGTLSTTQAVESIKHAYVETCSTCAGSGQTRCTICQGSGQTDCTHCMYGRAQCVSCGGSGNYVNSNNTRTNCSACGGSGKTLCGYCHGSGRVQCSSCSGRGSTSCTACSGTGYFTHVVTARTSLLSTQTCRWNKSEHDAWVNDYLQRALEDAVPQAPLNMAVHWDLDTFEFVSSGELPYRSKMHGLLESTQAKISLTPGTTATSRFIGEQLTPYDLDGVFDPVIEARIDDLASDYHHDKARRLFNSRFATSCFNELNTPDRPDSLITWANMLSPGACKVLKQSLIDVGHIFETMRSEIRLLDLGRWILIFTLFGLVATNLLNGFANAGLPWEQVGLRSLIAGLPVATDWFLVESMRGADSQLIPYMLVTFFPAMLVLYFFGTPQTWTLWRMMLWYWGFSLFIGLFLVSLNPLLGVAGKDTFKFSLETFRLSRQVEWGILVDILLLGSLLALLRARRLAFNLARKEAAQVQSKALNMLLKYETRD